MARQQLWSFSLDHFVRSPDIQLRGGRLTMICRDADPEALARRRLSETIALEDPGELTTTRWAETERKAYKQSLPPPPGEYRRCDVSFRIPEEKCGSGTAV